MNVFWTDESHVYTCPVSGCVGNTPTVISGGAPASGPLALGSRYVDWVDSVKAQVTRASKGEAIDASGPPPGNDVSALFAPVANGQSQLLATAAGVYWASPFALQQCLTSALATTAGCTESVGRLGPVFASPPTRCDGPNDTDTPIATDGINLFYLAKAPASSTCAGTAAVVMCTPQASCSVLVSKLTAGTVLAANASRVFWADTKDDPPVVTSAMHP